MKIGYLILGHTAPPQIVRAIERLRPTAALFVVHIDARADPAIHAAVAAYAATVPDVRLAPRQRCYWGSYGIMRATFACVRTLLAEGAPFDYAVLLSGQDYPIQSAARIAAFFDRQRGAEFIEAFPLAQPNRWTAQGGRFQALARVLHYTVTFRSRVFHLPVKRRFHNDWEPHGGSQWWGLTREAVQWLDRCLAENPALARYFRLVFIPDETMIQTMIANSPFRGRISAEPVHYVDWERPNPKYPRTLDDEDFARLRAAPQLFARKLHPELSASLLDRIDRELLD